MAQFGSLINYISNGVAGFEPEVGMGATILHWSDRSAATIVEVQRFKGGKRAGQVKAVVIQGDKATRTDSNGMSESQTYTFEAQPDSPKRTFTLRKDGRYRDSGGTVLRIGSRDEYYDYSF